MFSGAQLGGGAGVCAPFCNQTWAIAGRRDMSDGHVLSHPIYYKYICAPLSKLPSCPPGSEGGTKEVKYQIFSATKCTIWL